ncbi:MAG TPA: DUF3795 domain-containing protein [Tepiditoga sp.]|nr:DUF3795 domain-containing protein [Thermotogota bacterium]HOO73954.1 DUF3795 domain-containing protein [Tepiditoga sp.]
MIAYCGLNCSECDIFIATQNNDKEKILSVLKKWQEGIGLVYNDSDLNGCNGCKSDMVLSYCSKCDIKDCAVSKDVSMCSECSDYKCERIKKFYGE